MNTNRTLSRKQTAFFLFIAFLILREFGLPSLNLYKQETFSKARRSSLTNSLFANRSIRLKIVKETDTLLTIGNTYGQDVIFEVDSVTTDLSSYIPLYKSFTASVYFSCYENGMFKGQAKISDHYRILGLCSGREKNKRVLSNAINKLKTILMEKYLIEKKDEGIFFSSVTMWPNYVSLYYPFEFRDRFGNDYFPKVIIKPSIARGKSWTDTLYLDPNKYHGLSKNIIHLNYQDSIVESTLLYESGKIGFKNRFHFSMPIDAEDETERYKLYDVNSHRFHSWHAYSKEPLEFFGPDGELKWRVENK